MNLKIPEANNMMEASVRNSFYFQDYLEQMENITMSRAIWRGLPKTVNKRYLNYYLMVYGSALIFKDDALGEWYTLPFLYTSMDINGEPNRFTVQSPFTSYYNDTLTTENAVPFYVNPTRTSEIPVLYDFAYRLADILMTMETNRDFCKTPALITGPRRMKMQIEDAYAKRKANVPAILATEDFSDSIHFDLLGYKDNNLYMGDKLQYNFLHTWNEFLAWSGVPNVQQQKRERLIQDEVSTSMGGTLASAQYRLESLKEGAMKLSELMDSEVNVNYALGVMEDGKLYNRDMEGAGSDVPGVHE